MKNSTRRILMVLIGAYLAYTGVDLTRAVIGSAEKNKWMFLTFAIIFLVFGVALIIMNIKAFIQESWEKEGDTERKEDDKQESDRCLLRENEEKQPEDGNEDREEESHCE